MFKDVFLSTLGKIKLGAICSFLLSSLIIMENKALDTFLKTQIHGVD